MKKILQLRKIISDKKADALLLTDVHPNHSWLIGRNIEHSMVIVRRYGKPIMVKTLLEKFNSKEYKIINVEKRKQFKDELKKLAIKRLCVDFRKFTLARKKLFRGSKLIDVAEELSELRATKNNKEISNLKKANELTAQCFNAMMKEWKKFKHENDAIKFIKKFAIAHDCWMAFDPLIASGKNGATPHHRLNTKLNRGFCVIDFGFDYKGYKADMTRTIYLGKPSKKETETYAEMLRIQKELVAMVLPGTVAGDLDKAARTLLEKNAKYFTHSLGHGTGLEIHEKPNLSPDSKDVLKENMVVTIEPGIYNTFGIRIEDSLLVRKGSPEILTKKATKKLIRK